MVEIKDIGKVKYVGRGRRKSFDEMSIVEREERARNIEELRFRRRWKI